MFILVFQKVMTKLHVLLDLIVPDLYGCSTK